MRITVKFWGKGEGVTYTSQSCSSGRPKSDIREHFVYLSNLAVYWTSSDMNELVAIRKPAPLKETHGGE